MYIYMYMHACIYEHKYNKRSRGLWLYYAERLFRQLSTILSPVPSAECSTHIHAHTHVLKSERKKKKKPSWNVGSVEACIGSVGNMCVCRVRARLAILFCHYPMATMCVYMYIHSLCFCKLTQGPFTIFKIMC